MAAFSSVLLGSISVVFSSWADLRVSVVLPPWEERIADTCRQREGGYVSGEVEEEEDDDDDDWNET